MKTKAKTEKAIERENMKKDGFFDGRYRSRVIPNKKKKEKKEWGRKKGDVAPM